MAFTSHETCLRAANQLWGSLGIQPVSLSYTATAKSVLLAQSSQELVEYLILRTRGTLPSQGLGDLLYLVLLGLLVQEVRRFAASPFGSALGMVPNLSETRVEWGFSHQLIENRPHKPLLLVIL